MELSKTLKVGKRKPSYEEIAEWLNVCVFVGALLIKQAKPYPVYSVPTKEERTLVKEILEYSIEREDALAKSHLQNKEIQEYLKVQYDANVGIFPVPVQNNK